MWSPLLNLVWLVRHLKGQLNSVPLSVPGLALAWVGCLAVGCYWLNAYETSPGVAGEQAVHWPVDSPLRMTSCRQLLLFAHPRCPCTHTSLDQLASMLAVARVPLKTTIVFFRPPSAGSDWVDTPVVRRAMKIPGVQIVWDDAGQLAQLHQVHTSGHALCYTENGQLTFSGGLTAARGHVTQPPSADSVAQLLKDQPNTPLTSAVFGCPLGAWPTAASTTCSVDQ